MLVNMWEMLENTQVQLVSKLEKGCSWERLVYMLDLLESILS